MLRGVMLSLAFLAVSSPVYAREACNEFIKNQTVIYKCFVDGKAHYSLVKPRGVGDCKMINEYGMEICAATFGSSARRNNNLLEARIAEIEAQNAKRQENEPPEGSITRAERCEAARNNLQMLQTKPTVYEEDGNGNLVPLSESQRANRIEEMNRSISELCD